MNPPASKMPLFIAAFFLVGAAVVAGILLRHSSSSAPSVRTPSAAQQPGSVTAPLNLPARPEAEIHSQWRTSVEQILARYDQDKDASAAQKALLPLTVTNADRNLHLALVLAFSGIIQNTTKAQDHLVSARADFAKAH